MQLTLRIINLWLGLAGCAWGTSNRNQKQVIEAYLRGPTHFLPAAYRFNYHHSEIV